MYPGADQHPKAPEEVKEDTKVSDRHVPVVTEAEDEVEDDKGPHKLKRMAYYPPKGLAWNPLMDYPRNEKCFCGSGVKFKKCHLTTMPKCVLIKDAEEFKRFMDQWTPGTIMKVTVKPDEKTDQPLESPSVEETHDHQEQKA